MCVCVCVTGCVSHCVLGGWGGEDTALTSGIVEAQLSQLAGQIMHRGPGVRLCKFAMTEGCMCATLEN